MSNQKLVMKLLAVMDDLYEVLLTAGDYPMSPETLKVGDQFATHSYPWFQRIFYRAFPPMVDRIPTRLINAWKVCSLSDVALKGDLYLDVETGGIYTTDVDFEADAGLLGETWLLKLSTKDLFEVVSEVSSQCQVTRAFVLSLAHP